MRIHLAVLLFCIICTAIRPQKLYSLTPVRQNDKMADYMTLAPKTFLTAKLSLYQNMDYLKANILNAKIRLNFKNSLPEDLEKLTEYTDSLFSSQKKITKSILQLRKTLKSLSLYHEKHERELTDFSIRNLIYKSLILILYEEKNKSQKVTLKFLKKIENLASDSMNGHHVADIKGISGMISGIYEVTVKRATALINIPSINRLNVIVSSDKNEDVQEWDGISSNSIFEFKFKSTLFKLYSQILGINKAEFYIKTLANAENDDTFNPSEITNIVYWGENGSRELAEALLQFNDNKGVPQTVSGEKSISYKFSINRLIEFIKDKHTLDLLHRENPHFSYITHDYISKHIETIMKYFKVLEKRAVKKNTVFDIIIGISNPFLSESHSDNNKKVRSISGEVQVSA